MNNRKLNFVFMITDSQRKDMVGAYGNPWVDTPNLEDLFVDLTREEVAV